MAPKRELPDKHMGVAELKRRFADVIGEVMHTGRRVVIERRGRPVAVIGPLAEAPETEQHTPASAHLGEPLSEEVFEEFQRVMKHVLASRQNRTEWRVAEPESDE